jgi:hypothetical protein
MALIDTDDIELELQTTLPAGYTTAMIESIADDEEATLVLESNRTSFTGSAEKLAKKYVLYRTIDRLLVTNPDLVKTDVKKISENDSSVEFVASERSIRDYASEAEAILKKLTIKTSFSSYTYTNTETFYSEEEEST